MAFWPNKNEQGDDLTPESDELQQLTEHLGELGKLFEQLQQEVATYLLRRESKAETSGADAGLLNGLGEKLDSVAKRLDQLAEQEPADVVNNIPTEPSEPAARGPIEAKLAALEAHFGTLDQKLTGVDRLSEGVHALGGQLTSELMRVRDHLADHITRVLEMVSPEEPQESGSSPAAADQWQQAILGSELAGATELAAARARLFEELLAGDRAAQALAGRLLVFRSASAEKMPTLLKEIGEAYYRWQPKSQSGTEAMEQALVAWLKQACDLAEIGNTIELVHPGERFDASRHTATGRGVEIINVLGWVVLRDNGRVYTKAAVEVK